MERLTLDMTAIRDALENGRPNHHAGQMLLRLSAAGDVELGVPPQGIGQPLGVASHVLGCAGCR